MQIITNTDDLYFVTTINNGLILIKKEQYDLLQ